MKLHVLIPTDLSKNAQKACDHGIELFDRPDTKITLLNTFNIPYIPLGTKVPKSDVVYRSAKAKFDVEIERIEKKFPELKSQLVTRFEIGDVVSVVKHIEKNEDISVVVMGTKGASGIAETLVGSRTSAMIKKIDAPIFAVPDECVYKPIRQIMFATDLRTDPDLDSDSILHFILEKYSSKIDIVHITNSFKTLNVSEVEYRSKLESEFAEGDTVFSFETNLDIVEGIEDHLKDKPADLIAITSERGDLFRRIFHKSITKKIVLHTEIPTLVMHAED